MERNMDESRKQFAEAFEELTGWEIEDYPDQAYADTCWEFWRMSREAIEIELPLGATKNDDRLRHETSHEGSFNLCLYWVHKAIRAAGIKVKE